MSSVAEAPPAHARIRVAGRAIPMGLLGLTLVVSFFCSPSSRPCIAPYDPVTMT